MKKTMLLIALALLTACSTETAKTEATTESVVTEVTVTEATEAVNTELTSEMIGGEEKGDGILYIENESGTSENGNVLYIMKDDYVTLQIGVYAEGMDGSQPTVFYVDGQKLTEEQLSDSQTVLELKAEHLTPGIHNVEAIQGDTFYRLMQYEVR